MIVRELFGKLGLNVDGSGFAKANSFFDAAKKGLTAVVAGAVAAGTAITAMVMKAAEAGDQVDELSQATGVSRQGLQELAYAASSSGIDMQGLAGSLGFLNKSMDAAAQGGEEQAATFQRLGVSIRGQDGALLGAEDVLGSIADRFKEMPDGAAKASLATKIFGRSGQQLIPFLNAGADGIARLRQEANDLGVVMDDKAINASVEFSDNVGRLKAGLMGLMVAIAGPLMPVLSELITNTLKWVKANKEQIKSGIVSFTKGLIAVLKVVWTVVKTVAGAVGGLIQTWETLTATPARKWLTGIAVALAGATIAVNAFGVAGIAAGAKMALAWAKILGPIALLILFFEDLYYYNTGGKSVIGETIKGWTDIFSDFAAWWGDLWDGITKAIDQKFRAIVETLGEVKDGALNAMGMISDEELEVRQQDRNLRRMGVKSMSTTDTRARYKEIHGFDKPEWTAGGLRFSMPEPTISPGAPSQSVVNAPVQVSVVAAPGQDTSQVARKVGDEVRAVFAGILRATAAGAD